MALHDSSDYLLEVRLPGHFLKSRDSSAGFPVPLPFWGWEGLTFGTKEAGAQNQCIYECIRES